MDRKEATTFEHGPSLQSMAVLCQAAQEKGCECEPYQDWFTYRRWQALGFQVQKGEKSTRLLTFIEKKDEDGNVVGKHPWTSHLFCRCQVKPIKQQAPPGMEIQETEPRGDDHSAADKPPRNDWRLAGRFRKMADNLGKQIKDKRGPMTQNPTPRRMSQYQSRLHDANNLENLQKALRAIADAMEAGTLPKCLEMTKTRDEIGTLVRFRWDNSGGYYDGHGSREFADDSEAGRALQAMIAGSSEEQEEARRKAEVEYLERQAILKVGQVPGFFPTPRWVAEKMVELADIEPGMSVLEPSAGSGAIADTVREMCPNAHVGVIELNWSLRELLEKKGHYLCRKMDFLEHHVTNNGVDGWHRIVMNPPFENREDCDHVRHAYDCLKAGGRVVAVMSEGTFFANGKAAQFREWLDDEPSSWCDVDLPVGAFDPYTGIKARIVVIDK